MIKVKIDELYNKIHKTTKTAEEVTAALRDVEARQAKAWYESNFKDFSFYNTEEYLSQCLLSYFTCSHASITNTINWLKNIPNAKQMTFFTDYNGIGLETLQLLSEGYDVSWFNDNSRQSEIFAMLVKENNLKMPQHDKDKSKTYDVTVSLEIMEHFQEPLEYFKNIGKMTKKYLVLASSFSPRSPIWVGHFKEYTVAGQVMTKSAFTRLRTKVMKLFFKVAFKGWNGKPIIYEKIAEIDEKKISEVVTKELEKYELKKKYIQKRIDKLDKIKDKANTKLRNALFKIDDKYYNFNIGMYPNGNPLIKISNYADKSTFKILTCQVEDALESKEIAVKTWFENSILCTKVLTHDFFEDTGKRLSHKFGEIQIWRVNDKYCS